MKKALTHLIAGALLGAGLGACSTTEQQVDELLDQLASNEIDSEAWYQGIDGLVAIGRPAARQLTAHLDPAHYTGSNYREFRSEIEKVRTGCARALGRIKPRAASAKLAACIVPDTYTDTERLACLWGVGEIGFDRGSVEALEKELEKVPPVGEDPNIRLQLAIAMVKMDEHVATDLIEAAIAGADDTLAGAALEGLKNANYFGVPLLVGAAAEGRPRRPQVETALEQVKAKLVSQLDAEEPSLRYHSARALGTIGDSGVSPELVSALDDPSNLVRFNAAAALTTMNQKAGIDFLFAALGDDDPTLRINAVKFLTEIQRRSSAVEQELIAALERDDPASSSGAAQILGQARVAAALPALLAATRNTDPQVRWNAVIALGRIGSDATRNRLEQLLEDGDPTVAYYARWALTRLGQG
jgi:HEAT repeat protein